MQKLIFTDGVEYLASDFTFWATAIENALKNRTTVWAGVGGVFTGGVVATVSGLVVSVSGPFKGHANGDLIQITSPANLTCQPSTTNYVVATYATADDTPATFYGSGSPPDKHRNDAPTITVRTSGPAVIGNNEIDLATVVTGVASVTTITDTRIILPQSDNSGNLLLGNLKTVDGMDPSVHQVTVGNTTAIGHLLLGASGGASPYTTLRGAWQVDEFIDVGSAFSSTKILDDSDFTSPPASSQPFVGLGVAFETSFMPTREGDLRVNGYGVRVCSRYTLTFTANSVQPVTLILTNWDDTIRVKANGTTLYTNSAPSAGTAQSLSFNTVNGTNTLQVYNFNNNSQYNVMMYCAALALTGIVFTG